MCVYTYIYIYVYRESRNLSPPPPLGFPGWKESTGRHGKMRGWWNTLEIVLSEISNSMKPNPSAFQAYTGKLRPAAGFLSKRISMRFPTAFRQPLRKAREKERVASRQESGGGD